MPPGTPFCHGVPGVSFVLFFPWAHRIGQHKSKEVLSLNETMEERCELLARYIIERRTTVRSAAKKFGISKSTVHKDLVERLPTFNRTLYLQAKAVLEENKAQRHIRGGQATREKYRARAERE